MKKLAALLIGILVVGYIAMTGTITHKIAGDDLPDPAGECIIVRVI
jgi:hypothetical protein